MRTLFLLILALNAILFGVGKGWFGTPPAEQGRNPARVQQQVNAQAVEVGTAAVR